MDIQKIRKFIETENLFNKFNCKGVGISTKRKNNKDSNQLCIVFYVDQKKHISIIENDNLIPKEFIIDGEKIKTDIQLSSNFDLKNFTLPSVNELEKINEIKKLQKIYDEDGELIIDNNPLEVNDAILGTMVEYTHVFNSDLCSEEYLEKALSGRYLFDTNYNYSVNNYNGLSYNPINYINDPNNLNFSDQLTASNLFRNRVKARPLSGGTSSIYYNGSDATLAGIVMDSLDKTPVGLSNNHVYGGNSNVGMSNLIGSSTVTYAQGVKSVGKHFNFVGLSARQPARNNYHLNSTIEGAYNGPLSGADFQSDTASATDIIGYMKRVGVVDHHVYNDGIINKNMIDSAIITLTGFDLIDSTSNSMVNLKQDGPYEFCSTNELDSLMDANSPNFKAPMFRSGRSLGAVGYPGSVTENSNKKQKVYPNNATNLFKLDKKFDKFIMTPFLTTAPAGATVRYLDQSPIAAFNTVNQTLLQGISSNNHDSVSAFYHFGKGSSFRDLSGNIAGDLIFDLDVRNRTGLGGGVGLLPHGDTTDFEYDGEFKHLIVRGSLAFGLSSNNKFVWRGSSPFGIVGQPLETNLKSTNRDKTPWAIGTKEGDENYRYSRGNPPLSSQISNGDGQYFNDYYWSETFFNSPSTVGEWCNGHLNTTQSELTSRIGPIPEEDLNDIKKIEIISGVYNLGIYILTHSGKLYVCGVQDNARSLGIPIENFPQNDATPEIDDQFTKNGIPELISRAWYPLFRYLNETYVQKELDLLGSDFITDQNPLTGIKKPNYDDKEIIFSEYTFQSFLSGTGTRFNSYTPLTGYANVNFSQPGGFRTSGGSYIDGGLVGSQVVYPWYQIGGTYDDIYTSSNAETPEMTDSFYRVRNASNTGYSTNTVLALSGNTLHYTVPWVQDKGDYGSTGTSNFYLFPEGKERYNLSGNPLNEWGNFKKIEFASILNYVSGLDYNKPYILGMDNYLKSGLYFFGLSTNDQWVFCSKGGQRESQRGDLIHFTAKPNIEELPFYGDTVTFNKNNLFPQVLSGGTGSRYTGTGTFGKPSFPYSNYETPVTNIQYALSGDVFYIRTFGKVNDYSVYDTDLMHPISSYLVKNNDTTDGKFVKVPGMDNINEIYGTFCDDQASQYNNFIPTQHSSGVATKFIIQSGGEWYFTGDNTSRNFPLTSEEYPYMEVIDIDSSAIGVGGSRFGTSAAVFNNVFVMRAKYDNFPVAMGGDSGSMVLALLSADIPTLSTWKVAGQLFAGNIVMNGNSAICNRIDRMQEQLKIEPWDGTIPSNTHKTKTEFATVTSSDYAIYSVVLSGRTFYNVGLSGNLDNPRGNMKLGNPLYSGD